MSEINPYLDKLLERWRPDIYRFCLLLSMRPEAAEDITFQTFLYIGADPPSKWPVQSEEEAAIRLFRFAARSCEDYYFRKMRRRPGQKRFRESVPFPVSDPLWQLIKNPFSARAVLFLRARSDFPLESIARILNIRPAKVARLSPPDAELPALSELLMPVQQSAAAASMLPDRLYLRFHERNVSLENRLRDIRAFMDRAIIWIAGAIILLCAAAVWYTSQL